jgi:hypothetical protein
MKRFIAVIILLLCSISIYAQEFGLSFSYFIPKNGYFSTPVSPFSIRGLGFDITKFLAFETGGTLYRMSGMNVKGLPFESKNPIVGPNFTIFVPAELVFQLKGNKVEFDIKGGVFGFYGFDHKINYGNLDRAIRTFENLQIANSTITYKNKPGYGYHVGAELTVYVTSQLGISLETNYLVGDSKFPIKGSFVGSNGVATTETVLSDDYQNAKIDFTGYEFSIGLIFNSGGGGKAGPPKKKKRRR